jgi:D-alanyl-lipoteichoic acid acyltransferase DltB (MBOAT superfamily)
MAIGAAQVMGFHLMTNFNRPYFAKSISEFWKRWHISLSTWFKDYLYVPLGGNRVVKWRWYFNLFITFMISGLWHGANWTFIVWGALHGFYLVFALITADSRNNFNKSLGLTKNSALLKWMQSISVFVLVSFAWIFFRAATIQDAFTLIQNAFIINSSQLSATMFSGNYYEFFLGVFFIILLLIIEWTKRGRKMREYVDKQPAWIRYSLYLLIVLVIINFGVFGGNNFIYFQF